MKDFLKMLTKNKLLGDLLRKLPISKILKKNIRYFISGTAEVGRALSIEYFIVAIFGLGVIFFIVIVLLINQIGKFAVNMTFANPVTASSYPAVEGDSSPTISARAFVIYDKNARVIVEGKNEHLRFAPASTVKIMTALVALEHYNLDQVLVARNLSEVEGSKMDLLEGEAINVRSLLYGLMLPSGNDAAYTLATSYPGGVGGFVAKMNQKARIIGLENTHFVDPSGIEDTNYTTSYDLVKLGSYALTQPVFSQIVKTRYISVSDESGKIVHQLENLNELLVRPEVIGIKTGFTNEAGGVLVSALSLDDSIYVIAILKSDARFFDTEEVIDKIIIRIRREKY